MDPIAGLLVAANIVWTGAGIVRRSVAGLMDSALPSADLASVKTVLEGYRVLVLRPQGVVNRRGEPRVVGAGVNHLGDGDVAGAESGLAIAEVIPPLADKRIVEAQSMNPGEF